MNTLKKNLPFRPAPVWLLMLTCALLSANAQTSIPPADEPSPDPTGKEEAKDEPAASHDVSADKFWQALKLLQGRQTDKLAEGRDLLQESSDLENVHAQVLLGNCYLSGSYGFKKDPRKALNLFRLAAERGNAYAKVSLGTCFATGTGARRDETKAAEWLTSALEENADFSRPVPPEDFFQTTEFQGSEVAGELANDPEASSRASAHFLLGQILMQRKQESDAQVHFVAAATSGVDGRSGIYQAAVLAAVNYAFGRGLPRDPAKAQEMIDQSRKLNARMGVSLIHNYVALKFVDEFAVADLEEEVTSAGVSQTSALQYDIARGLGDKKSKDYNPAEAARWYQLAADSGQVWAMLSLGLMHAQGDLGPRDLTQAFQWFEKAGAGDKPKHTLGIANFAIGLQHGLGTTRDPARASEIFQKYRDESIVCHLGALGQSPTQFITFEDELKLLQTWARDKKDPTAQYLLGLRYYRGDDGKADPDEAVKWFKRSAKAKHGKALCMLGWLTQFRPADFGSSSNPAKNAATAAQYYKDSSEAGEIEGMANYALCLARGYGVSANPELAIAAYEKCLKVDPEHSRSHSNLGEIYNRKIEAVGGGALGTAEWQQQMLAHYEASARLEPPFAALLLGDLYYQGKIVKQDLAKAYHYFEIATNVPAQKALAHYQLGYMHEFGQGVPVTYSEAAYHYRLAALEGNVPALRRLVAFYTTGTGVSLDLDRAVYWLDYMSRLGQWDALISMSDLLLRKQDYTAAVRLLNLMKDSYLPQLAGHAHQRLSLCYSTGNGVNKNPKLAEKHLQQAIKLGNGNALTSLARRQLADGQAAEAIATFERAASTSPAAAYSMGLIYFHGTNVTPDRTKALKYLRQAANENLPDALIFLAVMCWNHEQDAPKIDEAIDLATKAENLGHPQGTKVREKLEQRRKENGRQSEEASRSRAT